MRAAGWLLVQSACCQFRRYSAHSSAYNASRQKPACPSFAETPVAFVTNFFGSGNAFFLGVGLILLGVVFKVQRRWKRLGRLTALAVVLGATLVALSATPLPYWLYAVIGVLTLVWLVSDRWLEKRGRTGLGMLRALVFFAWLGLFGWEYSYRL